MNEFYNLILKQVYLVSLSFKERMLANYVQHIKNFKGGRIDGLKFSKIKVLKQFSSNMIQNLITFISYKERFSKFRRISKKFNVAFE